MEAQACFAMGKQQLLGTLPSVLNPSSALSRAPGVNRKSLFLISRDVCRSCRWVRRSPRASQFYPRGLLTMLVTIMMVMVLAMAVVIVVMVIMFCGHGMGDEDDDPLIAQSS